MSKRTANDSFNSTISRTITQVSRRRKVDKVDIEEVDLKGLYAKLSQNRFDPADPAPYLVYLFDSRAEYNIAEYHPAIVGKRLAAIKVQLLRIYAVGSDAIALIFPSYSTANSFVENTVLVQNLDPSGAWRATIPDHAIYKIGVIHEIPLELTIQDIWHGIDDDDKKHIL